MTTPAVLREIGDALNEHLTLHRFGLIAFCVMPDHLHLIVRGLDAESCLVRFVRGFKQASGHRMRRYHGIRLWQEGFFDHVLRNEAAVERHVKYILENPVRAGLVDALEAWAYSDANLEGLRTFPRRAVRGAEADRRS